MKCATPHNSWELRPSVPIHSQQIHHLLKSVWNRKTIPTEKSTVHHHYQTIVRTHGELKRRSSDPSSRVVPNQHHHWCQSGRHIWKILYLSLTWNCDGYTREVTEEEISSSLLCPTETLHHIHSLHRRTHRMWRKKPSSNLPGALQQIGSSHPTRNTTISTLTWVCPLPGPLTVAYVAHMYHPIWQATHAFPSNTEQESAPIKATQIKHHKYE